MAMKSFSPLAGKPRSLKGVPEGGIGERFYFAADLGGVDCVFVFGGAKPPMLYVDTDADGDLSDESPCSAGGQAEGVVASKFVTTIFGPISLGPAGGPSEKTAQLSVRAHFFADATRLILYPAGVRAGEIRLGGRSYQVAVVDGDCDGRYDGIVTLPLNLTEGPLFDVLGIDLNGNHTFEMILDPPLFETLPLPKMLSVEDTYYSVDVAADGSAIRLKEIEPAFGTLDAGSPDVEAVFLSENGFHVLSGSEGKWRLPAGKYVPLQVTLKKADDSGLTWKLSGQFNPTELPCLEISPGETQTLDLGPPLSAQTNVQSRAGFVSIGFSLVGRGNETYAPGAMKDGQRNPAPKFEIADESGKVVLSDAFQYG